MLPKIYRLTKNKDFVQIVEKGQYAFAYEIGIKWIKNNLPHSRFGIAVSLKIDKRAVVRNRIKRIIRSVLSNNINKIATGFDFLILVKPDIKKMNYEQIQKKLLYLLNKRNITHKNTND